MGKRYEHLERARAVAAIANVKKQKIRMLTIQRRADKVVSGNGSLDQLKVQLAILYKAEGAKHSSYSGLSLGSSEAPILRLYIGLLKLCYDKPIHIFRARIQHRFDQDATQLQNFWAKELSLSKDQFYKSYADARTKVTPTKRKEYMGVCVISCSGADIQLELEAIAVKYAQKIWGYSSAD